MEREINAGNTGANCLREVREEMGTVRGFILDGREGTICTRETGRRSGCLGVGHGVRKFTSDCLFLFVCLFQ